MLSTRFFPLPRDGTLKHPHLKGGKNELFKNQSTQEGSNSYENLELFLLTFPEEEVLKMDAPKFIKSNFGDDKEKVEDLLSDEETHRIVKKCLQMLTKEQRSLLLMRISGGINYLSFKEMAERKKCSENEVRELVIAGIKVLCKQLSKETSLKIKYTKEEFENLELLNDLKDVTDQNKAPEGGTQ